MFVEIVYERESLTGEPAFDVFVELLLKEVVQVHIARVLLKAFAKRKAEAEMAALGIQWKATSTEHNHPLPAARDD